jgi:transcriptional regulator with XRE-family HTH domain
MLRYATKEVETMKKQVKYYDLRALKGLLKEKNINYELLSKDANISMSALNNKLNGYSVFNTIEVDRLVAYLKISPDNIIVYFFPQMLRNAT